MDKARWLGISCPLCGQELNSWDVRCSKSVGYLDYQICENCLCKVVNRYFPLQSLIYHQKAQIGRAHV